MSTYTALTTLPGNASAAALGEALEHVVPAPTGVGVFELEDGSGLWEVGAYFVDVPDEIALALLAAVHGAAEFVVSEVPDTDWVAKVRRELSPVEAGRFFVHGAHDAEKVPDDRIGLRVEAAMAFGTGHHGTTKGCLEAFDRLLSDGFVPQRIADIGCGTAVLAMAAARATEGRPDTQILASDIDPVAVETARANVAINELGGRIRCIEAAGFDHPDVIQLAPFDLIFANILKGPLVDLAPAMNLNTKQGGFVIVSGILGEQAEEVTEVYFQNGLNAIRTFPIVEWSTLIFRKLSE